MGKKIAERYGQRMPEDAKVDIINDALRKLILDGEYGKTGRLPSLRMLAGQFGTTHEPINKVIQRLQAEGLLKSLGRAGVFVRSPQTRIPGLTQRFDDYLLKQGLSPDETDIEEPSLVRVPEKVAASLGIEEGTLVVRRYRRQGTTTHHYRLAENFYLEELAGGEILEKMQQDVHFDVLAAIQANHRKMVKRVRDDVIGRLPTLKEQELLEIVRNTPVLEVLRVTVGADEDSKDNGEIVIMYSRIIFVANYFLLSYEYTPYWESKWDISLLK
jgi:DNA-binding GntR family transcriptional regulator